VLFAKAARRVRQPRPVQVLREPVERVDGAHSLRVTLDMLLTWAAHVNHVREKAAQRLGVLGPLLNRRRGLSVRKCVLLCKQLIRPMMDCACPIWRPAAGSHVRNLQVLKSLSVFVLPTTHLGTLVTGRFTRIWGFHSSPTTSEHCPRVSTVSYLIRRNPYYDNLEDACADRGLNEVPRVAEVSRRAAGQPRQSLERQPSQRNE
jgi:hypothetical protein